MIPLALYLFLAPPNCQCSIQNYVRNEFKEAGLNPDTAVQIMMLESGGHPNAYNPVSHDFGLFQWNRHWHPEGVKCFGRSDQIQCEVKNAIRVVQQRGWREWSSYYLLVDKTLDK